MLQFVNSFACSLNAEDNNTFVLHFRQNEPVFRTSGEAQDNMEIETHTVASLVMDRKCAFQLQDAINQLLNDPDIPDEIPE